MNSPSQTRRAEFVKVSQHRRIRIGNRGVSYRLSSSRSASKLRVRVGPNGVEVIRPTARKDADVSAFLRASGPWIVHQLERVKRLHGIRRPFKSRIGEILFRGKPTQLRVEPSSALALGNRVGLVDGVIVVQQ